MGASRGRNITRDLDHGYRMSLEQKVIEVDRRKSRGELITNLRLYTLAFRSEEGE